MPSQISLSIVVLGEARELLSVLRRNRRFSYLLSFTTASQPAEHPLVKEVKSLRDIVRTASAPTTVGSSSVSKLHSTLLVPPDALLSALDPFLEVVKSRDASGIITGHALLSLDRIATRLLALTEKYDLLSQYAVAFSSIVDAAAACRFDATDPASDEVVLARITRVVSRIATSPALPLLPDAVILRAVEACLGIAAGRRRASDLLKRTADAALVDIFSALGQHVRTICENAQPASRSTKETSKPPPVIAKGTIGSVFGYALDTEAFSQHGPASSDVICALLELCSRMSDPILSSSDAERSLGMQLVSAILGSGGTLLRDYPTLKAFLVQDCSRAALRSLGLFQSHPSIISAAFTIAIQLVHVLEEDGVALLLTMLQRVYPYFISGYESVLPRTSRDLDTTGPVESSKNPAVNNSSVGTSTGTVNPVNVLIDPVIREIGLESLAALLSTPGLLCVVYRVADCELKSPDVVNPLLKALGLAAKTRRPRRRSKRLRASSSGANRSTSAAVDDESDEDDLALNGSSNGSESSRYARAASLLCAESILAVVDTINDRLRLRSDGSAEKHDENADVLECNREVRRKKLRSQQAADAFNASEKMGKATTLLAMLKERGLADTTTTVDQTVSEEFDGDVAAVVRFLRETPGLNKGRIGTILGEPDKLSCRILADYTATFCFESRPFTESLRVFLESFRLPGEAQKIDRIVQSFANRYYEQNKLNEHMEQSNGTETSNSENAEGTLSRQDGEAVIVSTEHTSPTQLDADRDHHRSFGVLKSADAAYVLSYSVVMLNTDQHNDSIRDKMTLEDFLRNCRGINEKEDLPRWFLTDIFNSIAAVEIRMSDEAGIGALTDVLWEEQVRQMRESVHPKRYSSTSFDEELFTLAWEPAVVAANAILNEAGDANSVQKALEGFLSVARCATAYRLSNPTDAVISSLTTATTVREGPLYGAIVRFGTDIKAQMACVALSGVSRQCADSLRAEGWQSLVAYLLRLHALGLLPQSIEQRLGGYGSELVGIGQRELPPTQLVPAWWPSQGDKNIESKKGEEKSRKMSRPNGFFASLIAASIGTEMDSEEEEDYDHLSTANGSVSSSRRASHASPYYLRMRSAEDKEARELARKCIAGCRIEDVIVSEAKILQSNALIYLSRAIARSCIRAMDAGKAQGQDEELVIKEKGSVSEISLVDWREIAPPSPKNDSSAIVGVSTKYRVGASVDSDSDFSAFGLSSSWIGQVRERDERKARETVIAFCIDLLCELTLQNRDRLQLPWPALHGLLVRVIAPATQPSAVLERAIVALLRIGVRLLHREELRDDVLRGLNLLVRLPADTAEVLSIPIASGVYNIVKAHGSGIHSTSGWHAILSILENLARYQVEAREIGLESISCMLGDQTSPRAVSRQTFNPLLHAILAYTSCSSIDVSTRALGLLYHLSQCVSSFAESQFATSGEDYHGSLDQSTAESEVYSECWGPLFLGFAASVRDARGKVRNFALEILEKVVAVGGSANLLSAQHWSLALSSVILPLMTQVFSTRGFLEATLETEQSAQKKLLAARNATTTLTGGRSRNLSASAEHQEQLRKSVVAACNRTRMKAITLTSKTFLQHHMSIASGISEDAFTELWIGVLEVFRVAIESGAGDIAEGRGISTDKHDDLAEHIPENVKNLLLVMSDCGLLKPDQRVRWNATFAVVRKFVPDAEEIISATTGESVPVKSTEEESAQAAMIEGGYETLEQSKEGSKVNGTAPSSIVVAP